MLSQEGSAYYLDGYKVVRDDPGFDVWADTTTLYVTVLRGHVPPPSGSTDNRPEAVAGAGILYIRPWDFARQLSTFRATGPAPASALAAFGRVFLGELWTVYGRQVPGRQRSGRQRFGRTAGKGAGRP
jgi:cholesterol oxidase